MFIRVTNNAEGRRGDPLLINVNNIISVYENHEDGGSLSTIIFGQNNMTWYVEESFNQVLSKIEFCFNR